ncbi:amino acid/amide ABC transporter substrate-binding protein (HAAT family) [Bradyrhizobium macuxiense]|uniref:Amino acid/amide ABC transporter substrate-binding protein (HAAT family) n=1 Tax=Bradyrhizobium macuxiense TaxID=1755647 RepID=A0A560M0S2_9BRAD|nr:ABC transporter substrate-binding protein [Bradyrhizobium macuxiense]TWC01266.1 amino acid/amide ABC transporter substrate-binding protein (HAAT family) [Bradyrhizobium macuxiense]
MRLPHLAVLLGCLASCHSGAAIAQISDDLVRIGVLNDQSGVYADFGGPGSVIAARMAVEDFGGKVLNKPVSIVVGDHQSKADIGAAIARHWFDVDNVDMAVGFDNSSVALAVEQVALQKNRIAIAGAVGTTAFTGKNCTPNEASWLQDSYALTNTLARSMVGSGGDTWFFITADYAFGYSMEANASSAVLASGGKVLGSVRHPINSADFSSYLLQAQASGAKVVGLANAGGDMINATKQAAEFGLSRRGQTLVSLLAFISDVHSFGLRAAQGLRFVTGFYWDRNDETRTWSKRFFERHGRIPTSAQASVYSAVRHYLRAIEAAGTDEPKAVMAKMREIPVNDFYTKGGKLREDGRLLHDMYFVQVKTPDESSGPWDYYKIIGTIPGDQAFRPAGEDGCPLAKR